MFPSISAEMARRNMTQKQLALKLNVSAKTVGNWMSGRTEIPASKLQAMARMFGCTIDYLLATEQT